MVKTRGTDLSLYFFITVLVFGSIALFLGGRQEELIKVQTSGTKQQLLQTFSQKSLPTNGTSKLAGLSCGAYGGPEDEAAQEMVYWHDIPSDR